MSLRRGDVERWHRWMVHEDGISPNTAGQNIKRCRQMMGAAVDDGLIEQNPFAGVKIDLKSDKTKIGLSVQMWLRQSWKRARIKSGERSFRYADLVACGARPKC